MVPMTRYATVGGVPLPELMDAKTINAIVERTKNGGGEFLPLLNTSAWVAPAASIIDMVESIVKDKKKVLPCAAQLDGEYGVSGLFIGVLAKLGKRGMEGVIEVKLDPAEKALFEKTVAHVEELKGKVDEILF